MIIADADSFTDKKHLYLSSWKLTSQIIIVSLDMKQIDCHSWFYTKTLSALKHLETITG